MLMIFKVVSRVSEFTTKDRETDCVNGWFIRKVQPGRLQSSLRLGRHNTPSSHSEQQRLAFSSICEGSFCLSSGNGILKRGKMPRSFLLKRFVLKPEWDMKVPEICSQGMLNYAGVKHVKCPPEVDRALDWREEKTEKRWALIQPLESFPFASTQWKETQPKQWSGSQDSPQNYDGYSGVGKAPSSQQSPNSVVAADETDFPSKRSQQASKKPAMNKKEVYKCDQCGKIFKTKYTLTIHLKMPSHTGARPFVCAICGKGFRLSSTLCRHKIIHTSHKPHQCHTCGKAFNRSSTLKTHQRTHSSVKEFNCDICDKGFHQKGNLRNHLLIHTGEKPYKCSQCCKAFNKLSNLKFHSHIHTDNRPYRCRLCKITFTRRCDLKDHLSKCSQQ